MGGPAVRVSIVWSPESHRTDDVSQKKGMPCKKRHPLIRLCFFDAHSAPIMNL